MSYTPSGLLICADAVKFVPRDATIIDIKNAHYYVWSAQENKPYLINLDGNIDFYEVETNLSEEVTSLTLTTPPPDVVPKNASGTPRTYEEERQNFANWYSYYRRRELTATAAVANAIWNMEGVKVGLYSINAINDISGSLKEPVLEVKTQGKDFSQDLLDGLYSLTISNQETPLRKALEAVGKYFSGDNAGIGESPYATAPDGGECQQAFAILMTDGYWNGAAPAVGDADADNNTEFDGPPYAGPGSNTLADVAMYYYENDLSTGLDNDVPTSASDTAAHQHMITYAIGFGVSGSLDPTGPYPETWPNPINTSDPDYEKYRIDDLWHAAVNGRGEYLSALDPQGLANALLSIKLSIEARTGSAAPVSVNGVELYEEVGADLFMFQSTYNSNGWTGDVKAYEVNSLTGEISETPAWSAADWLHATDTRWYERKIAAYNPDTLAGVPFTSLNLNVEQRAQLDADESTAEDILFFLRGDRSNEQQNGGTFRNRFSILGDIVHSSPVFENGVLYAGANDGMLHAFRSTDGLEVFAYIPNLVFENLYKLAYPAYQDNHIFYVDLSPVIQKGVGPGNMTLLVGGLGGGGQGYYALDITGIDGTPFSIDADAADRVLWEYAGNVDNEPDLGLTYARPSIVGSNYGCPHGAEGCDPYWIVITGNGYNSTRGNAVLIILNASDGTEITRIDTGAGACNGLSTPVVIDVNYDDKADYVYAGDLEGNLWKFDLTDSDYTKWGVAYGTDSNANGSINGLDEGDDPQPLFRVPDQPITTKPDVMRHPQRHGYIVVFGTGKYLEESDLADTNLNTIYGVWDYGDDSDDSEYLGSLANRVTGQLSYPTGTSLLKQEIVPSTESDPNFWTVTAGGEELKLRILTANPPDWATTTDANDPAQEPDPVANVGWFFDLPVSGERVVSDVIIRDGNAIVISFIPPESCSTGGYSIVHEMDAATGGRLSAAQFDINADDAIGIGDLIQIDPGSGPIWVAPTGLRKTGRLHVPAILRMGSTEMKYFSSSEGTIKTVRERPARLGVRYWRELE